VVRWWRRTRNRLGRIARTAVESLVVVSSIALRAWLSRQWRDAIAYHIIVALGYRVPVWNGDVHEERDSERSIRITTIELRD